jgi:GTP diphosphokinase / guanosine-3',5'-bis(diphosphate) 3'-diphosphatase
MRLPQIIPGLGRSDSEEQGTTLTPEDIRYQKQILEEFQQLNRHLRSKGMSRNDRMMVRRAFEFAQRAHDGVKRKSGEPYILHPLSVARITVEEIGLVDAVSASAAFLHDVVEDTELELHDIEREFGTKTMQIIDGLTKITGSMMAGQPDVISKQAENFRKVLLTIADDIRVVLIKLADRLHNMRTLDSMRKESKLKIASETLYIYAPLAHRLGLYAIKTELEDLAFFHSQPAKYEEIATKLEGEKADVREYIARFINGIRGVLRPTGLNFEVRHRFKSTYSIYVKMLRKNLAYEDIYDKYAIRIILQTREGKERGDCWRVYSLVSGLYTPNPMRLRDWITVPKENGYESLHTTLGGPDNRWVEVQIRTTRMDEVAEKGVAAHWKYKDNGEAIEQPFTDWIAQIREILANPSRDALEAVQDFKENLKPNDVYVFTPAGEMLRLPVGSTVLDFAYQIHSDVGNSAIGAKVGNRVVSLEYKLRAGDMVEVLTSRKGEPKEEWLRMVQTHRAKGHIKTFLRKQRRELVERGYDLFRWRAKQYGIHEQHPYMKELLAFFMEPTPEEFYYALATRRVAPEKIAEFIEFKKAGKELDSEALAAWDFKRKQMEARFEEAGIDPDQLILSKDAKIESYKLAKCCNPLPGDDILGFNTDDGVVIHRTGCPKALQLMSSFGSQIIQARWAGGQRDIAFLAAFRVVGLDKQGMLLDLIRIISQRKKINIRKVSIESQDTLFEGIFHLYVSSLDELSQLMQDLKDLTNVYTVNRLEFGPEESA